MSSTLPGGGIRRPGLDHLRAFAIVFVFLYHYRLFANQSAINALGAPGWSGVDLFFVLSGYLIGAQLFARHAADGRVDLARFYGKRLLRTLPPYLAVLGLYYAVPAFIDRSALPPLWKFLTFTQNLSMELWSRTAFSHAWSLCVEEHFYLLFPLGCLLFLRPGGARAGAWVLSALLLAGPALRALLWLRAVAPLGESPAFTAAWYRLIYYPTWSRLDGLLVGVSIAAFSVYRPAAAARIGRHAGKAIACGLALLAAAGVLCQEQQGLPATVLGFPLFSLGYGALVLSALSPEGILERFDSPATRFLAASSYSLYLTHKSIIHLTLQAVEGRLDRDGLPAFAVCCLTSLLAGAGLHFAIERPALRLRERWLTQRRDEEPPASAASRAA